MKKKLLSELVLEYLDSDGWLCTRTGTFHGAYESIQFHKDLEGDKYYCFYDETTTTETEAAKGLHAYANDMIQQDILEAQRRLAELSSRDISKIDDME